MALPGLIDTLAQLLAWRSCYGSLWRGDEGTWHRIISSAQHRWPDLWHYIYCFVPVRRSLYGGRKYTHTHNHRRLKLFDVWIKYNEKDDATNLFKILCNETLCITVNDLTILEKFVLSVYYPKQSSFKCIDQERMDTFNPTPNSNLRSIPFSRKVLKNTPSELVYKVVCCGKKARKG